MSEETWLPVPDYGRRYEVSNLGRIRSYLRPGGRGFIYSEARPVVHIKKRSGYVVVSLMGLDGKQKKKPVHRLVALAFMPDGCKPGYEVNHKDSNRGNPRLMNLEWVTKSGNNLHAVRSGNGAKPKLTEDQREEAKRMCVAGVLHRTIRGRFKVGRKYISKLSREAKNQIKVQRYLRALRAEGLPA